MYSVIDKFVEALSASGAAPVAARNLGARRPSGDSDLPAVSISLTLESKKDPSIRRFVRSGDSLAKSSSVIQVKAAEDTFSPNLKSLRIAPLPLKKNPSSTKPDFTENDVQIRNVTDHTRSIQYRLTANPAGKEEFKLDAIRAQVEFGAAQTAGDLLELTHWTMTWRDEVLADRYLGSLAVEVWDDSFERVDQALRKIQEAIRANRRLLREKGFLKLQPFSLDAAEHLMLDPPGGSAVAVWRQRAEFKFAFEIEDGGELSSGVPIKQINADTGEFIAETFSIR